MRTFSDKIRFDIKSFFDDCIGLLQDESIVNYFSSESAIFPKKAFDLLDSIVFRGNLIYNKVEFNRHNFDNYSDFVVFDQIEDFLSSIRTIENYSRWLRSSIVNGRFRNASEISYTLRQNQSMESFAREVGYSNGDIGSLDLTRRNFLKETDYTLDGGLVFKFSYQNENLLRLQSVVDEMTGENLLGKDICRTLSIVDNDILSLSPKETFVQTCEILTGLLKNSNPEFPEDGFDKSSISNKNIMNCRLSTFIRQMYSIVKKDDSIAEFSIENISMEGDSLKIDMEFRSNLNNGETVKDSVYGN